MGLRADSPAALDGRRRPGADNRRHGRLQPVEVRPACPPCYWSRCAAGRFVLDGGLRPSDRGARLAASTPPVACDLCWAGPLASSRNYTPSSTSMVGPNVRDSPHLRVEGDVQNSGLARVGPLQPLANPCFPRCPGADSTKHAWTSDHPPTPDRAAAMAAAVKDATVVYEVPKPAPPEPHSPSGCISLSGVAEWRR